MGFRSKIILGFTLLLAGLAVSGVGLWLLVSPAQYRAMTRIETNPVLTDIPGNRQGMSYDPYLIQTNFEIIQSEAVLGKVVAALNLNVEWGNKYGGGIPLKTVDTIERLRQRMDLRMERNTKLVELSFTSSDPNEAAGIANAVAAAFKQYRLELRDTNTLNSIRVFRVLTEEYQKEQGQISVLQTNVDLLRGHVILSNVSPDSEPNDTNPYWNEKRKLDDMIELHKYHAAQIAAEKIDFQLPKTQLVTIIDHAQPPKLPVGPNRFLGATLLVIGLFPAIGGLFLLKSSRRPSA